MLRKLKHSPFRPNTLSYSTWWTTSAHLFSIRSFINTHDDIHICTVLLCIFIFSVSSISISIFSILIISSSSHHISCSWYKWTTPQLQSPVGDSEHCSSLSCCSTSTISWYDSSCICVSETPKEIKERDGKRLSVENNRYQNSSNTTCNLHDIIATAIDIVLLITQQTICQGSL